MKKICLVSILCICILLSVVIFSRPYASMRVSDIRIEDYNLNPIPNADANEYNADAEEIKNSNVKRVILECNIKNESFFKDIINIGVSFDESQSLPTLILGKRISNDLPWSVSLKPLQEKQIDYNFIIDAKDYSEEEILRQIENIDLCVVSNRVSKKSVTKDSVVSRTLVKCKKN